MIRAAFDDIIRPFLDHLLVNPGESRTLAQLLIFYFPNSCPVKSASGKPKKQ